MRIRFPNSFQIKIGSRIIIRIMFGNSIRIRNTTIDVCNPDFSSESVENALSPRKPDEDSDEEDFFFTEVEDESDSGYSAPHPPSPPTLSHRDMARPPHEDPEYQRQIVGNYRLSMSSQQQQLQQHQQHPQHQLPQLHQLGADIKPPLPATPGSHQQQQLHHQHPSLNNNNNTIGGQQQGSNGTSSNNGSGAGVHTSPLIHHNYTWSQVSPTSPQKHVRLSPRPAPYNNPYPNAPYANQISQQHHYQQQQHLSQIQLSPGSTNYHHQSAGAGALALSSTGQSPLNGSGTFVAPGTSPSGSTNRSPLSPNRRTRGENKKCRKVYGMDHKDQWCTQCKWKKACSRFGD
ncbi:homeobox protein B-H1-like [Uranotaenia lowii]|uniref:homeobox protein B-H1-like n=1 Tax=Uranotaenia lowii TaxID=190385 RepID=UPI00247A49C1|nr:homeobox protein B-H1-like [Uranotaenia lowii]